jgi:hypothetical protein
MSKMEAQARVDLMMSPVYPEAMAKELSIGTDVYFNDFNGATPSNSRGGWQQIGSGFYVHYSELGADGFTITGYGYGEDS